MLRKLSYLAVSALAILSVGNAFSEVVIPDGVSMPSGISIPGQTDSLTNHDYGRTIDTGGTSGGAGGSLSGVTGTDETYYQVSNNNAAGKSYLVPKKNAKPRALKRGEVCVEKLILTLGKPGRPVSTPLGATDEFNLNPINDVILNKEGEYKYCNYVKNDPVDIYGMGFHIITGKDDACPAEGTNIELKCQTVNIGTPQRPVAGCSCTNVGADGKPTYEITPAKMM